MSVRPAVARASAARPQSHPFLLVRRQDFSELQASAAHWSWAAQKANAIEAAHTERYHPAAPIDVRAIMLARIFTTTALAYVLDPARPRALRSVSAMPVTGSRNIGKCVILGQRPAGPVLTPRGAFVNGRKKMWRTSATNVAPTGGVRNNAALTTPGFTQSTTPPLSKESRMKLCLMTLGCPAWDLDTVIRRAAELGFDGIDFRGIGDQIDVTRLPAFTTDAAATKRRLADHGLVASGISSSIRVCDPDRRAVDLDEARRTLDVALAIGAANVRVFGEGRPAIDGYDSAANAGGDSMRDILALPGADGVRWTFETHDHWIRSADCRRLLDATPRSA